MNRRAGSQIEWFVMIHWFYVPDRFLIRSIIVKFCFRNHPSGVEWTAYLLIDTSNHGLLSPELDPSLIRFRGEDLEPACSLFERSLDFTRAIDKAHISG